MHEAMGRACARSSGAHGAQSESHAHPPQAPPSPQPHSSPWFWGHTEPPSWRCSPVPPAPASPFPPCAPFPRLLAQVLLRVGAKEGGGSQRGALIPLRGSSCCCRIKDALLKAPKCFGSGRKLTFTLKKPFAEGQSRDLCRSQKLLP